MQYSLFSSIFQVSEVVARLRQVIEADASLGDVWVAGEVSNSNRHTSGHFYFTLKDSHASLRCVMWKSQVARLPRIPRDGEAVYAHGYVSIYDVRGEVQLYADQIELAGAGALWQEFERLKQRLQAEGLFDPERKRPLVRFPRAIGIVTSKSGAVLHDILHTLERRYPLPQVYVAPTPVQGADAPPQIVAALEQVQQVPEVDVIILARGGGSIEDLWAFNDERVARAIVASRIPVVCGVGHETDVTIADFCADLRAPTPTAAAEFCTPDRDELHSHLRLYRRRLRRGVREILARSQNRRISDLSLLLRASPRRRIDNYRQLLDDRMQRGKRGMEQLLTRQRLGLLGAVRHMEALNPKATLQRGYAVVSEVATGKVVTSSSAVTAGEQVNIRVHRGEFKARVE